MIEEIIYKTADGLTARELRSLDMAPQQIWRAALRRNSPVMFLVEEPVANGKPFFFQRRYELFDLSPYMSPRVAIYREVCECPKP